MTTLTTIITVNAKGGYTATPPSQTVTMSNTTLVYQLDATSNQSWQITGLSDTDPLGQLSNEQILNNGEAISVVDANTKADQFSVFINIKHRTTGEIRKIDPEVSNVPPV